MQIRVLSDIDCERVHEATLTVLARTGVDFAGCLQAHDIFLRQGCKVENGRVFFPPEVVVEALARVPDRNQLAPCFPFLGFAEPLSVRQGDVSFGLIGNAFYLYDYAVGQSRDCLESDISDKLLVLDSLPNFRYDCCNLFTASERGIGRPLPRTYSSQDACLAFLRKWVRGRAVPGRKALPIGDRNMVREEQRLTVLGHAIIEGGNATRALLDQQVPFVWCNPLSPLRYKPGEADAIIQVARADDGWSMISPEIMLGASGPVTLAGALVQHNSEVLAGIVLSQLARAGSACIYGCVSAPMDLRNADISQGNFETGLFSAAVVRLADRYGLPSRISPGNSSDRRPSARALAETAVGLYLGAAAGGSIITTGLLDSTVMISYEHLVVVDELIGQIRSATSDILTDADSLALEVMDQVGRDGRNYLGCEHTLQHMKRDIYYSEFTGRIQDSYEDWYDRAHQHVDAILARQESDTDVDEGILARLAVVESELKQDDLMWREDRRDWYVRYLRALD